MGVKRDAAKSIVSDVLRPLLNPNQALHEVLLKSRFRALRNAPIESNLGTTYGDGVGNDEEDEEYPGRDSVRDLNPTL